MGDCLAFPEFTTTEDSPLVPEGIYDLNLADYCTWIFMGRQPKVVLDFRIITPGDCFGVIIPAYYNVTALIGKIGRKGRFKAAKKSKLVRELAAVLPDFQSIRYDRLPVSKLSRIVVIGKIGTVKKAFNQRVIPESVQYSVVREIQGCSTS